MELTSCSIQSLNESDFAHTNLENHLENLEIADSPIKSIDKSAFNSKSIFSMLKSSDNS